tara:strand:+ start:226 stop:498 length:273 start_codon:yes stop_codon:yes gene_type:complete
MVKVGKYNYEKSTRKDKKLMTEIDGKKIHFGNPNYQHFKDKTGIWKELDHNDKQRRKNYLTRSKAIKNKKGELTYLDPLSPNYHAIRILW